MTPAMYIFVNKGLGMSTGKVAAQAAHAAVEAFRISMSQTENGRTLVYPHTPAKALYETNEVRRWYCGGHYMKLVMECRDDAHIRDTKTYLANRGFNSALILDEGHTEVAPIVPTALGVEIVDKDLPHVQATFQSFDLYRDEKPQVEMEELAATLATSRYRDVRRLVGKGEIGMARTALLKREKAKLLR